MTATRHRDDGPPRALWQVHRWSRAVVVSAVARGAAPSYLVADSPEMAEPLVAEWGISGRLPPIGEFLNDLIDNWIATSSAAQISIAIPFGGERGESDGVLVLSIDADEFIAERAVLDATALSVGDWQTMPPSDLPVAGWQERLAENAARARAAAQPTLATGNTPGAGATRPRICPIERDREGDRAGRKARMSDEPGLEPD